MTKTEVFSIISHFHFIIWRIFSCQTQSAKPSEAEHRWATPSSPLLVNGKIQDVLKMFFYHLNHSEQVFHFFKNPDFDNQFCHFLWKSTSCAQNDFRSEQVLHFSKNLRFWQSTFHAFFYGKIKFVLKVIFRQFYAFWKSFTFFKKFSDFDNQF